MNLMESLSWAIVELQSARPDMDAVRAALNQAVISAAKEDIHHEVRKAHLVRLVAVHGGY